MYRQGDVLVLDPVAIPENARRLGSTVVAEGEATGHAHRLSNGTLYDVGGAMMLVAERGAVLTHEEHGPVALDETLPGMAYPIIIQREYDDEKEWRQVVD